MSYYPLATTTNSLLNRLMSDPFESFFSDAGSRPTHLMTTDIRETEKDYQLEIDLPGFKKEDVNATLKDGYLTVSAKTSTETKDEAKDGTYLRQERFVGSCKRSFYVGEDVQQGDIKAQFEGGVLTIVVPKKLPEPKNDEPFAITIG